MSRSTVRRAVGSRRDQVIGRRDAASRRVRAAVVESLEGRAMMSVVAPNSTTAGAISLPGESDEYTFSAAAGDRVLLALGNAGGINYEPRLVVYDPAGNQISNTTSYTAALAEFTAASAGTYTVHAREWDGSHTGSYRLHFSKLAFSGSGFDAADGEGETLASNTTTSGSIGTAGDFDVYTFNATAGERVDLSLGNAGGINYEPRMAVYGPGGAQLANVTSYTAAKYEFTAATGGKYYVVAREWDGGHTGSYRLNYTKLPHAGSATDPADGHGKALTKGASVAAAIGTPGDVDLYTFTASVGATSVISLQNTGGANYEPRLRVYGPGGAQLANKTSYTAATYEFKATTAGTYYVLAGEWDGGHTGTYNLTFQQIGGTTTAPEVGVTGNGAAIADGDLAPSTADHTDFGAAAKGGAGVSRTFTVRNTGSAALATSGLSVPAGFAVTEGLSASIAAGGSDTFTVRLNAATAGTFAGNVSFANNDGDESPYNFAVKGVVSAGGTTFAVLSGGVLTVTGTASADAIRGSIASNVLTLRLNNLTQTFANASAITRVVINALGGNDAVTMGASVNRKLTINGGDGDDTIVGGSAADTVNGGAGYDVATKGTGDAFSLVEEILA